MLDCPLDTRVDDGNDPYGGFNEVAPALQTDDLELDEGKNQFGASNVAKNLVKSGETLRRHSNAKTCNQTS